MRDFAVFQNSDFYFRSFSCFRKLLLLALKVQE